MRPSILLAFAALLAAPAAHAAQARGHASVEIVRAAGVSVEPAAPSAGAGDTGGSARLVLHGRPGAVAAARTPEGPVAIVLGPDGTAPLPASSDGSVLVDW